MRRAVLLGTAFLVASLYAAEEGKEKLKSGPQVGQAVGAFPVKDVTGPAKDKDPLCYI